MDTPFRQINTLSGKIHSHNGCWSGIAIYRRSPSHTRVTNKKFTIAELHIIVKKMYIYNANLFCALYFRSTTFHAALNSLFTLVFFIQPYLCPLRTSLKRGKQIVYFRYAGYVPQYRYRCGETYGSITHKLLLDPTVNHAETLILSNRLTDDYEVLLLSHLIRNNKLLFIAR